MIMYKELHDLLTYKNTGKIYKCPVQRSLYNNISSEKNI